MLGRCVDCPVSSVRTGFLHLAEALAYRRDSEVAVRGIIASLRAGEKCNAEPELIRKGIYSITRETEIIVFFKHTVHLHECMNS